MSTETFWTSNDVVPTPEIDHSHLEALLHRLYNIRALSITDLNGFYDKNYLVRTEEAKYVLKVTNSRYSLTQGLIEAENSMIAHLISKGIPCASLCTNTYGSEWSLEQIGSSSLHAVRLINFVEGKVLRSVPHTPEVLRLVGRFLAATQEALEDFNDPHYDTISNEWNLDNLSHIEDVVDCLDDKKQIEMVRAVIKAFELKISPVAVNFQRGLVHADFNEDNLFLQQMPDGNWQIAGLIDFGDSMRMCYVYDLAIVIMQLMSVGKTTFPLLDIGGYILAGYLEKFPLSQAELKSLKLCVAARYVQSLVIGRYTYAKSPSVDNEYVLNSQLTGWGQLKLLWETPDDQIIGHWTNIAGITRI